MPTYELRDDQQLWTVDKCNLRITEKNKAGQANTQQLTINIPYENAFKRNAGLASVWSSKRSFQGQNLSSSQIHVLAR